MPRSHVHVRVVQPFFAERQVMVATCTCTPIDIAYDFFLVLIKRNVQYPTLMFGASMCWEGSGERRC